MAKSTPTFVMDLPLATTPQMEKALRVKFEIARKIYNATVAEGRKRCRILRGTRAWREAVKTFSEEEALGKDKGLTKKEKSARAEEIVQRRKDAFKEAHRVLREHHKDTIWKRNASGKYPVIVERKLEKINPLFKGSNFDTWTQQFNATPAFKRHLESQTVKAIAKRVCRAFQRHLYRDGSGRKAGLPRFKRYGKLRSIEALDNSQGILWRGDNPKAMPATAGDGHQIIWKAGRGNPEMTIPAIIDRDDEIIAHGLQHPVKYCRVVWRTINGKDRFFVQLVLKGHPLQQGTREETRVERHLGKGLVGIDLGPSTIAVVSQSKAHLQAICEALDNQAAKVRRLERKKDRQRRAGNPDNYDAKGSIKRGVRLEWNHSKAYLRTQAKLADMKRREAATRKSLHGALVNHILTLGDTFLTEDVRVKDWQKRKKGKRFSYGKSIAHHAPAGFMALLQQRVEQLGGTYREVNTYTSCMSQTCQCGHKEKKDLKQRWHRCTCGVEAQRDLYSAFLCLFVGEDDTVDTQAAKDAWDQFKPVLDSCMDDVRQRKREGAKLVSTLGV